MKRKTRAELEIELTTARKRIESLEADAKHRTMLNDLQGRHDDATRKLAREESAKRAAEAETLRVALCEAIAASLALDAATLDALTTAPPAHHMRNVVEQNRAMRTALDRIAKLSLASYRAPVEWTQWMFGIGAGVLGAAAYCLGFFGKPADGAAPTSTSTQEGK